MTGVKVGVLLIRNTPSTSFYSVDTQGGQALSSSFSYNLGVPTMTFGEPASGRSCMHGLQQVDLSLYRDANHSLESSFLFAYNGSQISGISYNYL
jgi:hypothetical protein